VARVEPERVLAHDGVGVGTAPGEEPLEPLGESAAAEVEHCLRRVLLCERLARQEGVVIGHEALRAGAETDLGSKVGQERPT
jgi:hypothetical protein